MAVVLLSSLLTILCITASVFASLIALMLRPSQRPLPYAIIFVTAFLAFNRLNTISYLPEFGQIFGLFVLIWVAHISNVLCIENYELPPIDSDKQQRRAAYKMLFNGRWIGTLKEAPGIQTRGKGDEIWSALPQNSGRISTTTNPFLFLRRRLFSVLILCTIYYLYYQLLLRYPLYYSDFAPEKQIYVRRLFFSRSSVTGRETIVRIWTIAHFVFSNYVIFTALHDMLSIIFVVILRLDEEDDWPPLFGSVANAYSLRGFWGNFWHKLVYRTYTSFAKRVFLIIFRTAPDSNSLIQTLLIHFLVFFFSGITHAAVSWQIGCQSGIWHEVLWFCGNFGGLVVESFVLRTASNNYWAKKSTIEERRQGQTSILRRFLGYLSVFAFFFWSLPKAHYPRHYEGAHA